MSKHFKYFVIIIIIISFLFFGIYGVIAAKQAYVARVNGTKITTKDYNTYLSKRRNDIIKNAENDEKRNEVVKIMQTKDFEKMILSEMVNSLIISTFLKENNIDISAKTIAEYTKTLPDFKQNGKFSPSLVKNYAQILGMSEYDFLKSQIPQAEELIFSNFIKNFNIESDVISKKYFNSLNKTRNVEIIKLDDVEIPQPSNENLQQFYETIKEQFIEKPQHFVTISFIDDYIMQNSGLFASSPEVLDSFYNQKFSGNVFKFYLAIFKNKADAEKVYTIATKQGSKLQSVVETFAKTSKNNITKYGVFTSKDLEIPEILESVQKYKVSNITPIIKVGNEYAIAEILEINRQSFNVNDNAEKITDELKRQRKCNNVEIYIEKLKKEFQTGASFESIAIKYGLPISKKIIIDSNSNTIKDFKTNEVVSIYKDDSKLIAKILENNDTQYGHIFELDQEKCSFIAYKQTLVSKERIKTLAEVRGKIVDIYSTKEKQKAKELLAKNIAQQVESLKTDLNAYAKHGQIAQLNIDMNNILAQDVFSRQLNDVFHTNVNGNVVVIKIVSENKLNSLPTKEDLDKSSETIKQNFTQFYLKQLMDILYKKYNVETKI